MPWRSAHELLLEDNDADDDPGPLELQLSAQAERAEAREASNAAVAGAWDARHRMSAQESASNPTQAEKEARYGRGAFLASDQAAGG